jgi:protoporphyrinogen oxidase
VAVVTRAGGSRSDFASNGGSLGVAIIGGGPAGLTAAHALASRRSPGVVFEADTTVGGLAKTVVHNGFRFDIGGHRFFTKVEPIERLWEDVLGDDFLLRPRLSRIYYRNRFFSYPLRAKEVVGRLGLVESALCAASYLKTLPRRADGAESFEEWVTARFGRRLYNTFFRTYTEKVWGIPGSEIRSLWASQRIKNFSLFRAVLAILGVRQQVTTLIEEFRYPRLGPGQMWEAVAALAARRGVRVETGAHCVALRHDGERVHSVVVRSRGEEVEHPVEGVISTMPLRELIRSLDPPPPPEVLEAAEQLRYRSLCLVALMTTQEEPFPDNWIYIHDPDTIAGRVQNFGAWSGDMVRPGSTCLGVEYFCFEGDEIWQRPEREMVELAKRELSSIGLLDPEQVFAGVRVRAPKAYPVYDSRYESALEVIRPYLARFANLQTCGRNGLHRYNNQDHSMLTGLLAVLNLLDGASHDIWEVNTEDAYHEEGDVVSTVLSEDLLLS